MPADIGPSTKQMLVASHDTDSVVNHFLEQSSEADEQKTVFSLFNSQLLIIIEQELVRCQLTTYDDGPAQKQPNYR